MGSSEVTLPPGFLSEISAVPRPQACGVLSIGLDPGG